jgi:hypothetical protein
MQAKLLVGQVNDPLEHEADRVADQVMRMPNLPRSIAGALPQTSRKFASCEEEEEETEQTLQTKRAEVSELTAGKAPAIAHEVLHSPPQPLDVATRSFMESRFGHDLQRVRVPSDAKAAWDFSKISSFPAQRADRSQVSPAQPGIIQGKLGIGQANDPLEHEADRIVDRVTRMPSAQLSTSPAPARLSRKCTTCDNEQTGELQTKRTEAPVGTDGEAPDIVWKVLGSPGQPLDPPTCAFFETYLGPRFSDVRVHTEAQADASARAVQAVAYTVGRDVVFGRGQYDPHTKDGRRLLAHELAHVVQQSGGISASTLRGGLSAPVAIQQGTAPRFVARQNTSQTANVLSRGTTPGSGVQFWPIQITSTYIGQVSRVGGLAGTPNRLSVIVGQKMTLNALARLILPLWNSATPSTPEGATTPVVTADLTADQLARGLLVYNQTYLRVLSQPTPSMTGFASGLRFPLPVEIDANGKGVVNKELINQLATGFDPAWGPLLEQPATETVVPGTADLRQTVADFLVSNATADGRGMALATRAKTNALEARPFVLEAFRQLTTGMFDVALAAMNNLVGSDVSLLASQRDGAAILDSIRGAIAAPPATLSDAQQASLSRANLMLGSAATIVPRAPPAARTFSVQDVDFTRYSGGGDINAWIAQACQAAGVPANNNWVNGLLTLSQRESGNDPNTVNTSDVNATGPTVADGHPQNCSRGVAQVIPSTFLSFHAAGTSWAIYDPAANIAAAIGYIRNRYHVSLDGSNLAAKVQQADPTRDPAGY